METGGDNIVVEDIANDLEAYRLPVINNDSDEIPKRFKYSVKNIFTQIALDQLKGKDTSPKGCNCEINPNVPYMCAENCNCEKASKIWFDPISRIVIKPSRYEYLNQSYIECGPHCKCKGKCGRVMIKENQLAKKVAVKYMGQKGFGIIAQQPIAIGMPVGEYSGEVFIEQLEGERWPLSDYQIELFTPKKKFKFVVDSKRTGNITRFINHSCLGNIAQISVYPSIPKRGLFPPFPRIIFVAARDILKGQELSYSYGAEYFMGRHMPCLCFEPFCIAPPRKWIAIARGPEDADKEFADNKKMMMTEFSETEDAYSED